MGLINRLRNNYLIKTVRLIKYLRDIKQTFSCKSILLTTLLANQVGGFGDLFEDYDDLPTTLKIVINNLNAYLQDNVVMPTIYNPVNDEENFNRHWSQEKYTNFRAQIKKYNDWVYDAYDEDDQAESIKKWQKIWFFVKLCDPMAPYPGGHSKTKCYSGNSQMTGSHAHWL